MLSTSGSSDFSSLANVERFSGFADRYDAYRPQPPAVLVDILTQLAGGTRPRLVVDLGSGTGLSTVIWADRAEVVIGIEPSEDMRRQAERRAKGLLNVRYQAGLSTDTGLSDGCADIVTCSQSLHWMEPEPTFVEVARLLRPGGLFAAYDCDWPPAMDWEVELAYNAFIESATALGNKLGLYAEVRQWDKAGHLARMRASGCFRYAREIVVHHIERGDVERLVGLALSSGGVATLLKHGLSEEEIGVDELRAVAERAWGHRSVPWYWSYRVRLGVK